MTCFKPHQPRQGAQWIPHLEANEANVGLDPAYSIIPTALDGNFCFFGWASGSTSKVVARFALGNHVPLESFLSFLRPGRDALL